MRRLIVGFIMAAAAGAAAQAGGVTAHDSGLSYTQATYECNAGHKVEKRQTSLDSGEVRYTFQYSGCVDPSHGDRRPSAEGNFGMPEPTSANWYWGGFLRVFINGTDAVNCRVEDWRILERGERGALQVVFAHPDAELCLRLMLLPGSRCVLARLQWRPRPEATIKSVAVELRCYPSFFTAARGREGDRHCQTPRTDAPQGQTLQIEPKTDTYLFYFDSIFDVEKGEGDGPCAALVSSKGLTGGQVVVGSYQVMSTLHFRPEVGEARLGFYDFTGWTNARAERFLKEEGTKDLMTLLNADFRPQTVQNPDLERMRSEFERLLADAGEDGAPFRKPVEDLLLKASECGKAIIAGDWRAEADLASALDASADLFWKLRAFAVLNKPGQ